MARSYSELDNSFGLAMQDAQKRQSSKAAASEEVNRTLDHTVSLRTMRPASPYRFSKAGKAVGGLFPNPASVLSLKFME